jgi:hypothetical protein
VKHLYRTSEEHGPERLQVWSRLERAVLSVAFAELALALVGFRSAWDPAQHSSRQDFRR